MSNRIKNALLILLVVGTVFGGVMFALLMGIKNDQDAYDKARKQVTADSLKQAKESAEYFKKHPSERPIPKQHK